MHLYIRHPDNISFIENLHKLARQCRWQAWQNDGILKFASASHTWYFISLHLITVCRMRETDTPPKANCCNLHHYKPHWRRYCQFVRLSLVYSNHTFRPSPKESLAQGPDKGELLCTWGKTDTTRTCSSHYTYINLHLIRRSNSL